MTYASSILINLQGILPEMIDEEYIGRVEAIIDSLDKRIIRPDAYSAFLLNLEKHELTLSLLSAPFFGSPPHPLDPLGLLENLLKMPGPILSIKEESTYISTVSSHFLKSVRNGYGQIYLVTGSMHPDIFGKDLSEEILEKLVQGSRVKVIAGPLILVDENGDNPVLDLLGTAGFELGVSKVPWQTKGAFSENDSFMYFQRYESDEFHMFAYESMNNSTFNYVKHEIIRKKECISMVTSRDQIAGRVLPPGEFWSKLERDLKNPRFDEMPRSMRNFYLVSTLVRLYDADKVAVESFLQHESDRA